MRTKYQSSFDVRHGTRIRTAYFDLLGQLLDVLSDFGSPCLLRGKWSRTCAKAGDLKRCKVVLAPLDSFEESLYVGVESGGDGRHAGSRRRTRLRVGCARCRSGLSQAALRNTWQMLDSGKFVAANFQVVRTWITNAPLKHSIGGPTRNGQNVSHLDRLDFLFSSDQVPSELTYLNSGASVDPECAGTCA